MLPVLKKADWSRYSVKSDGRMSEIVRGLYAFAGADEAVEVTGEDDLAPALTAGVRLFLGVS